MSSLPPVVIDVGTFSLKAGFAGDENGPQIIRNWMGKAKYETGSNDKKEDDNSDDNVTTDNKNEDENENEDENGNGNGSGNENESGGFKKPSIKMTVNNSDIDFSHFVFGNNVFAKLHDLNIHSFYDNNGQFNESYKQGLQLFYKNSVFTELLSNMDDIGYDSLAQTNVLLTQQPFCSQKWKETMNEIMFETVNVKGINYQYSGVLSMYATNRMNGCVLDVGHCNSSVIPIIDGCPIENAMSRINLGGKHVDEYLQILLRKSGITFHTDLELERIREIKEKLCEFSLDGSFMRGNKDDEEFNVTRFELPDKKILQIGSSRLRAPEILFSPHLIGIETSGIHEMILNSIKKCDVYTRKILLSNVLLTGASTKIGKFGPRLLQEIKKIDENDFFDYKNVLSLRYADEWNISMGVGNSGAGRLSRAKRRSRAFEDSSSSSLYGIQSEARKSLTVNNSGMGNKNEFDNLDDRISKNDWKKTKVRLIALEKRDISSWIGGSILCSIDEIQNNSSPFWQTRDSYLNERREKDPNFKEPATPRELNQLTDDLADELLDDMD